jgi:hypothetical protein
MDPAARIRRQSNGKPALRPFGLSRSRLQG